MSGPRRAILRSLVSRSGDIVDASGFATAELLADPEVGGFPPQSVRRAIADLEAAGMVAREVNGRRVYRIGLTEAGHAAASDRGLVPETTGTPAMFPNALETGDRRVIVGAAAAIAASLQDWAATVDLEQPNDRMRLDFFRTVVMPFAGPPPSADELALAVVHANALNDALLAAYRTRATDIDLALVESHLFTVLELCKLGGAIGAEVERSALDR